MDFWISGFQFGFLQTVYEISFVTDPSKGGSCTSAGVKVYTAPGMKAHFRLVFD